VLELVSLKELKRLAGKAGVPQAVIEKDCALSIALKLIADSGLAEHIVFKGGTAIKKAYFNDARFSEDLDFTVLKIERGDCLRLLKQTLENKSEAGFSFSEVEEEKTTEGLKAALKFVGPLAYAQRIRFDFNFRENLVEKPVRRKLIDAYEVSEAELFVLSLEEVFAEKIHALGNRSAARDLYDSWFLFQKGVTIDERVLAKKFAYYDEKFDVQKAVENARKSKENWSRDLKHLLKQLPDFDALERETEEKLLKLA